LRIECWSGADAITFPQTRMPPMGPNRHGSGRSTPRSLLRVPFSAESNRYRFRELRQFAQPRADVVAMMFVTFKRAPRAELADQAVCRGGRETGPTADLDKA
jgi:hypothetical protein